MSSADPERVRDGLHPVHLRLGGPEPPRPERDCPDGGRCWHACGGQPCFRVLFCAPFTSYGPAWSAADVLAEAGRQEDAHDYLL